MLDNLRIYNRSLAEEEITALFMRKNRTINVSASREIGKFPYTFFSSSLFPAPASPSLYLFCLMIKTTAMT